MNTNNAITITDQGQGQTLSIAGGTYRILISGAQTNGSYAVIEMTVPPGGGPGPHAHKNFHEMFYVAAGEVVFKTESGSYPSGKGAFINIPMGGAVHTFKNNSNAVAQLICTVMPAGLDSFFQEAAKLLEPGKVLEPSPPTREEMEKIKALAEKYGQELYPPDYFG